MRQVLKNQRTILLCTAMGILASISIQGFSGLSETASAQTKEPIAAKMKDEGKAAAKISIISPPTDANDLSMEVAALRTLYLLKAGPDENGEHNAYPGFKDFTKECKQDPPRTRRAAQVSKNYLKLLVDLRAAFVAHDEDRIGELSTQLEELTNEEQPDLDDVIEITEKSKKWGPHVLNGYFDANRISGYVAAYGKDFPEPYILMKKTVRGDLKGSWPSPDVWKETREFVIQEVTSTIGGFDPKRRADVQDKVTKLLDRAYGMSDAKLKEEWSRKGSGMRAEVAAISSMQGPTDVIKHVLERDFAELLSNPRLLKAIEAREDYIKKSQR